MNVNEFVSVCGMRESVCVLTVQAHVCLIGTMLMESVRKAEIGSESFIP